MPIYDIHNVYKKAKEKRTLEQKVDQLERDVKRLDNLVHELLGVFSDYTAALSKKRN